MEAGRFLTCRLEVREEQVLQCTFKCHLVENSFLLGVTSVLFYLDFQLVG